MAARQTFLAYIQTSPHLKLHDIAESLRKNLVIKPVYSDEIKYDLLRRAASNLRPVDYIRDMKALADLNLYFGKRILDDEGLEDLLSQNNTIVYFSFSEPAMMILELIHEKMKVEGKENEVLFSLIVEWLFIKRDKDDERAEDYYRKVVEGWNARLFETSHVNGKFKDIILWILYLQVKHIGMGEGEEIVEFIRVLGDLSVPGCGYLNDNIHELIYEAVMKVIREMVEVLPPYPLLDRLFAIPIQKKRYHTGIKRFFFSLPNSFQVTSIMSLVTHIISSFPSLHNVHIKPRSSSNNNKPSSNNSSNNNNNASSIDNDNKEEEERKEEEEKRGGRGEEGWKPPTRSLNKYKSPAEPIEGMMNREISMDELIKKNGIYWLQFFDWFPFLRAKIKRYSLYKGKEEYTFYNTEEYNRFQQIYLRMRGSVKEMVEGIEMRKLGFKEWVVYYLNRYHLSVTFPKERKHRLMEILDKGYERVIRYYNHFQEVMGVVNHYGLPPLHPDVSNLFTISSSFSSFTLTDLIYFLNHDDEDEVEKMTEEDKETLQRLSILNSQLKTDKHKKLEEKKKKKEQQLEELLKKKKKDGKDDDDKDLDDISGKKKKKKKKKEEEGKLDDKVSKVVDRKAKKMRDKGAKAPLPSIINNNNNINNDDESPLPTAEDKDAKEKEEKEEEMRLLIEEEERKREERRERRREERREMRKGNLISQGEVFRSIKDEVLVGFGWLHYMKESSFFTSLFRLVCKEIEMEEGGGKEGEVIEWIVKGWRRWKDLFNQISTGHICASQLVGINRKEVEMMISTQDSYSPSPLSFSILSIDKSSPVISQLFKRIHRSVHIIQVYHQIEDILLSLDHVGGMMQSGIAVGYVRSLIQSTMILKEKFKGVEVERIRLEEAEKYKEALYIDSCYVNLNSEFFGLLKKHNTLIEWLRSLPNDLDYTSSVEIAMGKSEMECPDELWITVPGKPGRPDERKLSMLSSLRSYLHPFLYSDSSLDDTPADNDDDNNDNNGEKNDNNSSSSSSSSSIDSNNGSNHHHHRDEMEEGERKESYFRYIKRLELLGPLDRETLNNLRECGEIAIPLMELVASDGESSPDRLVQLFLPARSTSWTISNYNYNNNNNNNTNANTIGDFDEKMKEEEKEEKKKEGEGKVEGMRLWLEWTVIRKGEEVRKEHGMGELLDFQSSIVLARTDNRSEETQLAIEKFISQFAWLREMKDILSLLFHSGHFYYQTFHFHYSIHTDPDLIRQKVQEMREILADWLSFSSLLRNRFFLLNFISLKQIYQLLSLLHSLHPHPLSSSFTGRGNQSDNHGNHNKGRIYREIISQINTDLAFDDQILNRFSDMIEENWKRYTESLSNDVKEDHPLPATAFLEFIGLFLSSLHYSFPLDYNSVKIHGIDREEGLIGSGWDDSKIRGMKDGREGMKEGKEFFTIRHRSLDYSFPHTDSIISLIQTDEKVGSVYEHVLSFYAQYSQLPERFQLLMCSEQTTEEEMNNYLRRWAGLHLFYPPSPSSTSPSSTRRLFIISEINQLPFEIQRKAVLMIKDLSSIAYHHLHLISHSADTNHMTIQLQQYKESYSMIPISEILLLSERYLNEVKVYISPYPGAGKSFQIRSYSDLNGYLYSHIPIYHSSDHLIARLNMKKEREEIIDEEKCCLHFDLTNSIGYDFNHVIFNMGYFGLIERKNEEGYLIHPNHLVILEISSGSLIDRLQACKVLPIITIEPSASSFCSSKADLLIGMGEEFDKPRYDGTVYRKEVDITDISSSYQRLQYVCTIFDVMEKNNGRFPYVFEDPTQSHTPVEALRLSKSVDLEIDTSDLSGSDCFNLIVRFAKMDVSQISLYCIWNFINLMYWYTKNINDNSSPINLDCKPPPEPVININTNVFSNNNNNNINNNNNNNNNNNIKNSKANQKIKERIINKEKVKGEVINFLCATAQELSKRQVNSTAGSDIVSCELKGFYRGSTFNNEWARCLFDNDGQCCYYQGNHYLFFNADTNRWEINTGIDIVDPPKAHSIGASMDGPWWCQAYSSTTNSINLVYKSIDHSAQNNNVVNKKPVGNKWVELTWEGGIRVPKGLSIGDQELGKYNFQTHHLWVKKSPLRYLVFDPPTQHYHISTSSNPTDANNVKGSVYCQSLMTAQNFEWHIQFPATTFDIEVKYKTREQAQPALPPNEIMLSQTIKRWAESNHEMLLFTTRGKGEHKIVRFLSVRAPELLSHLHPLMREYLIVNKMRLDSLLMNEEECFKVLSDITGISHAEESRSMLAGKSYCLTGDNLQKMIAIYMRIQCGVPVILMGECGCGKTMLIRYLCAWLKVRLLVLDVNGGTSEKDIIHIFTQANDLIERREEKEVFVFLDEVNTCPHMGLISLAVCKRLIYDMKLQDGVQILAALNPYRRRRTDQQTTGLAFQYADRKAAMIQDEMSKLVYRVFPPPSCILDFIFDFGALDSSYELRYIINMVRSLYQSLPVAPTSSQFSFITHAINEAQQFVRKYEGDDSATSLRDVKRTLELITWFYPIVPKKNKDFPIPIVTSTLLAIAFVYIYRIDIDASRLELWKEIASILRKDLGNINGLTISSFGITDLILQFQRLLCSKIVLEEGISLNNALMENIFVMIICILNKIPVFVVGKPGSSKTLSLQVISSNLQGKQSSNKFWRKFPSIYVVQYQCSPMSDSHSIQHQFDMAVRYQEHAKNTITVLLLDEVGLAEHSPDMPLKVLHGMLVDPPISIVGLSNWVLDPAKMNRAIYLKRIDPTPSDITNTGRGIIIGDDNNFNSNNTRPTTDLSQFSVWLPAMARGYHNVYIRQNGHDFYGMRDYYHLLKLLRRFLVKTKGYLTPDILSFIIQRNFGGHTRMMRGVLTSFNKECFGKIPLVIKPTIQFVRSNLIDPSARHLMLLTQNSSALRILFNSKLLSEHTVKVLIGSEFPEDKSELYLINQINEVKLAMAAGSTIVLLNHDNIYEALYDVLNQRYLYKIDSKTKKVTKLLRLAIGSRSQLCQVHHLFKIVIVVEKEHAYKNLSFPLLNRFEKQVFTYNDVLGPNQTTLAKDLEIWLTSLKDELKYPSLENIICGYHEETLSSAVLAYSQYDDARTGGGLEVIKEWLFDIMLPVPIISAHSIPNSQIDRLFSVRSNLESILTYLYVSNHNDNNNIDADQPNNNNNINNNNNDTNMVLMTSSPMIHYYQYVSENMFGKLQLCENNLQLGEIDSEYILRKKISQFLGPIDDDDNDDNDKEEKKREILTILCDPIVCKQAMINQALIVTQQVRSGWEHSVRITHKLKSMNLRHSISFDDKGDDDEGSSSTPNQFASSDSSDDNGDVVMQSNMKKAEEKINKKVILFLIFLPPGLKMRERKFQLDIYNPWRFIFIDDLSSKVTGLTVQTMTQSSLEHILDIYLPIETILLQSYQHVISSCLQPVAKHPEIDLYLDLPHRIQYFSKVMENDQAVMFMKEKILSTVIKYPTDAKGTPYHIVIVNKSLFGGSLYNTLILSIRLTVSQLFAGLMRLMDRNFNINTYTQSPEIWLKLAGNAAIITPDSIFTTSKLGVQSITVEDIPNHGVDGPLFAQFPFSYYIMKQINSADCKNALVVMKKLSSDQSLLIDNDVDHDDPSQSISYLNSIISNIFGGDLIDDLSNYTNQNYIKYNEDLIAMISPVYPNLPLSSKITIYTVICKGYYPAYLQSLGGIHYCIWELEEFLFHVCSLISVSNSSLNQMLLNTLVNYQQEKEMRGKRALVHISIHLLNSVIVYFSGMLKEVDEEQIEKYQEEMINMKSKVSVLLALIFNSPHGEEELRLVKIIQSSFSSLHLISLFNEEYSTLKDKKYGAEYKDLLDIAKDHKPHSASYLSLLLSLFTSHPFLDPILNQFLLRYFEEIVFQNNPFHFHHLSHTPSSSTSSKSPGDNNDNEDNETKKNADQIEEELTTLIEEIINQDITALQKNDHLKGINQKSKVLNTNMQRLLVYIVTNQPDLIGRDISIRSVSAAQLYLQYQMDYFASSFDTSSSSSSSPTIIGDVLGINIASDKEKLEWVGSANIISLFGQGEIISYLQYLSKILLYIQLTVKSYYIDLSNTNSMSSLPSSLLYLIEMDNKYKIYVMRALLMAGGVDLIADMLINKDLHPWFPILNLSKLTPYAESRSIFDPFVLIPSMNGRVTDEYTRYQSAVKDVIENSNKGRLTEITKSSLDNEKSRKKNRMNVHLTEGCRVDFILASVLRYAFASKKLSNLDLMHKMIDPQSKLLLSWIEDGFKFGSKDKAKNIALMKQEQRIHLQLISHCAIWASIQRYSFWHNVLYSTEILLNSYLPAMPVEDLASFASLMPGLGWYRCPNGHPYAVGECTRPMVESYCNQCHALIGGRSHVSAQGNKRIKLEDGVGLPNYYLTSPNEILSTIQFSAATTFILRYFLHCLLLLAPSLNGKLKKFVDDFTKSNKQGPAKSLMANFEGLKGLLRMTTSDTAALLHSIMAEFAVHIASPSKFPTSRSADEYSINFNTWLNANYFADSQVLYDKLSSIQSTLNANTIQIIRSTVGDSFYSDLFELPFSSSQYNYQSNYNPVKKENEEKKMWRIRTFASFSQFEHQFLINTANQIKFPLLAQFLKEEERLPHVKFIIDILQWQSMLFTIFPSNTITRQEAAEITNEDAIKRLSPHYQPAAYSLFSRYAFAFNTAFPLIENLYECQKNPFINQQQRVDLSGTSKEDQPMSLHIPILFSLPCVLQSDMDFRGLCTIKLLTLLQSTHSSLLDKFYQEQEKNKKGKKDEKKDENVQLNLNALPPHLLPLLVDNNNNQNNNNNNINNNNNNNNNEGDQEGNENDNENNENNNENEEDEKRRGEVVPINLHTPRLVLESQLILYDRKTHLIPLLSKYQIQSLEYGEGKSIVFLFDAIERSLTEMFLTGKKQITLITQPFFFKGDFIKRSPLSSLRLKIPQISLTSHVKEAICQEIDTIERVNLMINLLELIINFLVSISISVNDQSILLSSYAVDVVKIDPKQWNETSTQSINQNVMLSHLQSLFITLEEQTKQSPVDDVVMKYRVPLDDESKKDWSKVAKKLDLNHLLPILRDFLTSQLITDNWSADASLKEYLTYVESGEDLVDHDWFNTYFPETSLQYSYHIYLHLSSLV